MSFRATLVALAQRKSSKEWLSRQSSDPWIKQRAQNDFYSRSAFKLLEISENYGNFLDKQDVGVVIDLGAAPGGWSQAAARKLGWDVDSVKKPGSYGLKQELDKKGKVAGDSYDPLNIDDLEKEYEHSPDGRAIVVAVDLLTIKPIPGVQSLKADFLHPLTEGLIHDVLVRFGFGFGQRKADIILSDIAMNMTGVAVHDDEASLRICHAVWEFARKNLRTASEIGRTRGGVLLLKHFTHPDVDAFRQKCLVPNFRDVTYIKPRSSRSESKEAYYLCRGFEPETIDNFD